VTVVDKIKAVVCCLLAASVMLSEKKKRKRKMWIKKLYLKRNKSCDVHLLNELLETDVEDDAIVLMAGKVKCPRYRSNWPREEIALSFLDLGARRGLVVSTTPWPLYPRERPGTHCTGGLVGPRAGLDVCEKPQPHRDSIPGPSNP
jgi:hypothetical protein